MKDKEMKVNKYRMMFIERIKEMFRIGIRTYAYSAVTWKYIERKADEYNIYKDLSDILKEEIKSGLLD